MSDGTYLTLIPNQKAQVPVSGSISAGQEKEEEDNEDIRMKRADRICHLLSRVNGTQDAEVALSAVCDLIQLPALA